MTLFFLVFLSFYNFSAAVLIPFSPAPNLHPARSKPPFSALTHSSLSSLNRTFRDDLALFSPREPHLPQDSSERIGIQNP
jgi:hypothetical protein